MLVSMLNGHRQIRCFRELMRATPRWMKKQGYRGALKVLDQVDEKYKKDRYRFAHPEEFVESVFATIKNRPAVCGFKLHINQHPAFLERLLKDARWKIILLRRENVLAQYSSHKISKITGQGNASERTRIIQAKAKFVDREFRKFLKKEEIGWAKVQRTLNACGKPYMAIEYTDLVNTEVADGLLDFLSIGENENLLPTTKKRNSSNILSRFSNEKTVKRSLENINKKRWMNEALNYN